MTAVIRPPSLLGATAARVFPDVRLLLASRVTRRQTVHLPHPTREEGWTACYGVSPPRTHRAGYQEVRAGRLCPSCAGRAPVAADLRPTRNDLAAWYGAQIIRSRDAPDGLEHIDALISAAIEAGVTAQSCRWYDTDEQVYPLHELVAPYRRTEGGLADKQDAARALVLNRPHPWARGA